MQPEAVLTFKTQDEMTIEILAEIDSTEERACFLVLAPAAARRAGRAATAAATILAAGMQGKRGGQKWARNQHVECNSDSTSGSISHRTVKEANTQT